MTRKGCSTLARTIVMIRLICASIRMKIATLGGLAHDTPDLARPRERCLALGANIALAGPDRGLIAMQQFVPDLAVVELRGRGVEAVGQAAVHIHAAVVCPLKSGPP
jgi:hypothetical protein